mmetsp:Transcript_137485/g.383435  ORF Transcript_137485/g.383435 Transcript_137485/m.383435 type:complete len:298 (-) Transcript_137485:181-1074(-)|eukprot:CAMPEP_0179101602 /NCGR_PEP_ID=MMETSP0796-20121207/46984_1 /TAXON_ID=73915 /ORGANISM="Pyrodinium bahamense, Strain pbaha01" /LENGTH=297 /DNA_ID=CAMNT_0020799457 /DNA_START=54 /DNA_END=947 /DNA_ORIENTATION=-
MKFASLAAVRASGLAPRLLRVDLGSKALSETHVVTAAMRRGLASRGAANMAGKGLAALSAPLVLLSALAGGPRRRGCRRGAGRAAAGEAQRLMGMVKSGDQDAILAVCGELPSLPADVAAQLVGDWKVEWSSLSSGRKPAATGAQPETSPAIKLRFLSFGALPDVEVCVVAGFNRVSGSAELGGTYELFQVFAMPGSLDVVAALVLGGPWHQDEGGKPGRASVHFQTVTLIPSAAAPQASEAMLKAAGLTVRTPIPVKAPPTFIDIEYIDDVLRVHRGESGAVYILSREEFPFKTPA